MQGLCSQTTLLLRCVSLERHPWLVMELHLQRHQLTISPSKWIGVGFTVLVTLLCLDTERAMWNSALICTWEIKLHLHSCKHACIESTCGPGCPTLQCKVHPAGRRTGWHSRILQFGLIYSPKQKICASSQLGTISPSLWKVFKHTHACQRIQST